jgi:hypothetical protein
VIFDGYTAAAAKTIAGDAGVKQAHWFVAKYCSAVSHAKVSTAAEAARTQVKGQLTRTCKQESGYGMGGRSRTHRAKQV